MSHLPLRMPGRCLMLRSVRTKLAGWRASGGDPMSLVCWVGRESASAPVFVVVCDDISRRTRQ
jgi:hypothetical protein